MPARGADKLTLQKKDFLLLPLFLLAVFLAHHNERIADAMPILFNFYISAIYLSLVLVVKDSAYFTLFVGGCAGIHFLLGYWNLTEQASAIHKWHLMLLFDSLQIYGGSRYFIEAYRKRTSYLRVQVRGGADEH
jgi:hypothetical protein